MKQLHSLFTLPAPKNQESFSSDQPIWADIKKKFHEEYGEDVFNRYMKNAQMVEINKDNQIVILCYAAFQASELADFYGRFILNALREVLPHLHSLKFEIAAVHRREIEEKQKAEQTIISKEVGKQTSLPVWSDSGRGVPNGVLRGSLFAAIQGKYRRALKNAVLIDEKNLKIKFTGWQFDQADLDVWEYALHIARADNIGCDIHFTANSFLKGIGRCTGKKDHEWLHQSFQRLCASCVEITHNNYTYAGNMLNFEKNEVNGRYKLSLNVKTARLYTAGWTQIGQADRSAIGNKPLALWLHGFIASHAELYPMKVETYHRLSGSNNKCMRDFKRKLQESLEDLLRLKLITAFRFEKDLVHIKNIPSNSQKKHLENKRGAQ